MSTSKRKNLHPEKRNLVTFHGIPGKELVPYTGKLYKPYKKCIHTRKQTNVPPEKKIKMCFSKGKDCQTQLLTTMFQGRHVSFQGSIFFIQDVKLKPYMDNLPSHETKSSHLKQWGLEDEFPFGKASEQVRTVSFRENISCSNSTTSQSPFFFYLFDLHHENNTHNFPKALP